MCGITGWMNKNENLRNKKRIIKKMTKTLKYRGPDSTGYFISDDVLLGHKRLAIIDPEKGKQPMKYDNYVIIYNGEIYNTDSIRKKLIKKGYSFNTTSDTEVILKGYACYKEKIVEKLEGIFAFAIYDGKDLFLARDRLGVKPLFYTQIDGNFLFASEIKALLKNDLVQPIIDKESLQELLGLGPSKIPGSGIFKGIKELRAAHYLTYKAEIIDIKRYWNVKDKKFDDTFEVCSTKVRRMLMDSIKRQMVSDVGISTFLSGGLDSSIITAVVSNELKKQNQVLDTYSIDYEDNDKYFKANKFQVSKDKKFIDIMKNAFKTNHTYEVISQRKLAKTLKESVIARDYPGMADIDSSLFWFSKQIRKEHKVILSGECADEIFGGYPWFYRKEIRERENFPWIDSLDGRISLIKKDLAQKLDLKNFVKEKCELTLSEINVSDDENLKKLFYLNMTWFMPTLLDRKDRMTMRASLEARVPFADTKLIEYLWNVPWKYKYRNNQEKGLLRHAFKNILPKEIIDRKKNPYPKTHNPKYTKIMIKLLKKRLKNKKSVLYKIFDYDKLMNLIETGGESFKTPWFGQLMTGPELLAYLYQFDIWTVKYKIILDI